MGTDANCRVGFEEKKDEGEPLAGALMAFDLGMDFLDTSDMYRFNRRGAQISRAAWGQYHG